jgi:hypothetical protein
MMLLVLAMFLLTLFLSLTHCGHVFPDISDVIPPLSNAALTYLGHVDYELLLLPGVYLG